MNADSTVADLYKIEGCTVQRSRMCFDCPGITPSKPTVEQKALARMDHTPHRCHNNDRVLCGAPANGRDFATILRDTQRAELERM